MAKPIVILRKLSSQPIGTITLKPRADYVHAHDLSTEPQIWHNAKSKLTGRIDSFLSLRVATDWLHDEAERHSALVALKA